MPPGRPRRTMKDERRTTMNIEQVMTRKVISVLPGTPLKEVAALLTRHRISGLPVCDAEGEIRRRVREGRALQGARPGRAARPVDMALRAEAAEREGAGTD